MKRSFFLFLLTIFGVMIGCNVDKSLPVNFYTKGLEKEQFIKYDEICERNNYKIYTWKQHANILEAIGYKYPDTNIAAEYFTLYQGFLDLVKNAERKNCKKGWKVLNGIFFLVVEDNSFPYIAVYDKYCFPYEHDQLKKDWGEYFHKKYQTKLIRDNSNRVWICYKAGIDDQIAE